MNTQTPNLLNVAFSGWIVISDAGVQVSQQSLRRGGVKRQMWLCRCICGREQLFSTTYIMPRTRLIPDKCRHPQGTRKIRNVGLRAIERMVARSGLVSIIKDNKHDEKD